MFFLIEIPHFFDMIQIGKVIQANDLLILSWIKWGEGGLKMFD